MYIYIYVCVCFMSIDHFQNNSIAIKNGSEYLCVFSMSRIIEISLVVHVTTLHHSLLCNGGGAGGVRSALWAWLYPMGESNQGC